MPTMGRPCRPRDRPGPGGRAGAGTALEQGMGAGSGQPTRSHNKREGGHSALSQRSTRHPLGFT